MFDQGVTPVLRLRVKLVLLSLVLMGPGGSVQASASTLTFDFEAAFVRADGANNFWQLSEPLTGRFSVDLGATVVDQIENELQGSYDEDEVSAFEFSVPRYGVPDVLAWDFVDTQVSILNDGGCGGPTCDVFAINGSVPLSERPSQGGWEFSFARIAFESTDSTVLSSDALPSPAELLEIVSEATGTEVRLAFNSAYTTHYVHYELTDVQLVPEPTTAVLLSCGLAGLAAAGRRRHH